MKFFIFLPAILLVCHCSHARIFGGRDRYDSFADAYSAMGDIDWSKRAYDNWISPAYSYSSMADTDWGWKKRSLGDVDDEDVVEEALEDPEIDKRSRYHSSYYTPYKYRQPYTLASSSYMPYKPTRSYTEPQASIDAAAAVANTALSGGRNTRSRSGNRQYSYSSMADMDWGWKRKRADPDTMKRNVASLARGNELPYSFRARRVQPSVKSSVAAMDPLAFLNHEYQLINEDDANGLKRETRAGIDSLARNGSIRPVGHHGGR